MDLIVPYDVIDFSCGLGTSNNDSEYFRTMHIIDTAEHTGTCTWSYQVVAKNTTGADQTITLNRIYDLHWADVAIPGDTDSYSTASALTINIPSGTTTPTLFNVAFSPTAGSNRYYWSIPEVSGLYLYTGRPVVQQLNVTNTIVWRPLANRETVGSAFDHMGSAWGTPSAWTTSSYAGTFYWDPTVHAGTSMTAVIEATMGSSYGGVDAGVRLYDLTDSTAVAASEFTVTTGGIFRFPQSYCERHEFDISNLISGHLYQMQFCRLRSWGGGIVTNWLSSALLGRAAFMVKITGVTKARVAYRVARQMSGPVTSDQTTCRAIITSPGSLSPNDVINETCSEPDYDLTDSTEFDFYVTDDGVLTSGDGSGATSITYSNAHQYPAPDGRYPIYSENWLSGYTSGNSYCARGIPAIVGGDANSVWTLVILAYTAGDYVEPDEDTLFSRGTLVYARGLMEGRSGWFYDKYTPEVVVHYGEEGSSIHAILLGCEDGGVYQFTGDDDAGSEFACQVRTMSRDHGDTRYHKLYGDILLDCETNGEDLTVTPGFDNFDYTPAPTTVNAADRTLVPVPVGTEWVSGRNVALDVAWNEAGLKPKLYAWEPRFTEDTTKLLAYSWETCFITHEMNGYFYHGYLYVVHLSTADLTFTVYAEDGSVAATVLIPNSSGARAKSFAWLPVTKGKIFKYAITSADQFRIDGDESELLVKQWGSSEGWKHQRIFQDVPRGEAA